MASFRDNLTLLLSYSKELPVLFHSALVKVLGRKLILKDGKAIYLIVMWQTRHPWVWPWAAWPFHTLRFDWLLALTALVAFWSPPWHRYFCVSAGELLTLYTGTCRLGQVLPPPPSVSLCHEAVPQAVVDRVSNTIWEWPKWHLYRHVPLWREEKELGYDDLLK